MDYLKSLGLVRYLIDLGIPLEKAIRNQEVSDELRDQILETLKEEENIVLEPANVIKDGGKYEEWLSEEDRKSWYYWPTLRRYLLDKKGWFGPSIQSLDNETDKILKMLDSPKKENFDKRGLVLGFVQSGKTSNYTALIAKAADSGYRLIIVLSGTDNGLRLQTHRRLKNELVGSDSGKGVLLPPVGKRWFEFTREELGGDFQPGYANAASLQGSQPVLLVIKKNGAVLRRLLKWLDSASDEIKKTLPLLVIDDEADLASIDTKGSRQVEEEPLPEDYEPPSVINGLIRDLLKKFSRKSYIAYTATPFANILIPHDNYDPRFSDDLYPKNFIINLPKPHGYFGAEELFGSTDYVSENGDDGIDVIKKVGDLDSEDYFLERSIMPPVMENAILSFILAGAAKLCRSKKDFPATMLIHITLMTLKQEQLKEIVETKFVEFRNEWRYARKEKIYGKLLELWEKDFLPVIKTKYPDKQINFEDLEKNISTFFESVQIRTLNYMSGDSQTLDYEKEPNLKLIAIGGNKLSRGLTLEGLLISFFTRRSKQYDTLMQMGRWFGFRNGYEDLTRIYTTPELADWFSNLAQVESELRQDIRIYEEQQLTPFDVGLRIKAHPVMQITSPSKRRFANERLISKSYDARGPRTINFKFDNLKILAEREDNNLLALKEFVSKLGRYNFQKKGYPVWKDVSPGRVIDFLERFIVDETHSEFKTALVVDYIKKLNEIGELTNWTVVICGRHSPSSLGEVDWGVKDLMINQINRSRMKSGNTLKNIENPGDHIIDLSLEEIARLEEYKKNHEVRSENKAARMIRDPSKGLILLYPISKLSCPSSENENRRRLYEDPSDSNARNLIGLAISFPKSKEDKKSEVYIEGTIPWRSSDEL